MKAKLRLALSHCRREGGWGNCSTRLTHLVLSLNRTNVDPPNDAILPQRINAEGVIEVQPGIDPNRSGNRLERAGRKLRIGIEEVRRVIRESHLGAIQNVVLERNAR